MAARFSQKTHEFISKTIKKTNMKSIKFSKKEQEVMDIMEKDGKITLDPMNSHLKSSCLELWYIGVIEKDKAYQNVFNVTELGKKAIEWNSLAKDLK